MKYLVIYCHPNPKSFCHSIYEATLNELLATGNEVVVRDLYHLGFDPVLKGEDFEMMKAGFIPEDIRKEQDYIRWADIYIYIYPIWWAGMPGLLKGYIDRTHLHGFAFIYNDEIREGLLKDKKAIVFNTQGTSNQEYDASGMTSSLRQTTDEALFNFCGIRVLDHLFFGNVTMNEEGFWQEDLEVVKQTIKKHRHEEHYS